MDWVRAAFFGGLIAYLAGAAAGVAGYRTPRLARLGTFGCALAGALLEMTAAVMALAQGGAAAWTVPFGVPLLAWTVRLNPLSAYFNLALGILAAAVSIYSFGYVRPMEGRRNVGALGFFYNLLLLGLMAVFTAGDAFFFLVAWEVMAVSAYCLVVFEHEKEETRRAGMMFLIMSHAGTGLLLIAFLLMAQASGSLDFASFHGLASTLPAQEQGLIGVLFFAGFGVKAGIIPIHVWLPAAHPVAPSNISAIMSGIMIKAGIYGMALVFFDFFSAAPVWMGMLVLATGVVSALLGVLPWGFDITWPICLFVMIADFVLAWRISRRASSIERALPPA